MTASVIPVLTNFLDTEEEALVAMAKGELEVLQIIHEPVAAVLAYAASQTPEEQSLTRIF